MMTLKQIAAALREDAAQAPCPERPQDSSFFDWNGPMYTRTFGTLRVTCPDHRDAILSLADKYARGLKHGGRTAPAIQFRPRSNTTPPATVLQSFMADGEHDNARAYLRLIPQDKWPEGAGVLFDREVCA